MGFNVNVGIYDAASKAPTQARIKLQETLLTASAAFEEKLPGKKKPEKNNQGSTPAQSSEFHASFNPIVRIEWPTPDKLYLQTAYVRLYNEPINTWKRWHLVSLSPQAAVLRR
jgi:hypothetical protein